MCRKLLSVALLCWAEEGFAQLPACVASERGAFHCTGGVTYEENAKFLMNVPDSKQAEHFRLYVNMSVTLAQPQHPLGWNASSASSASCQGELDAQAAVHYMQDVIQLNPAFVTDSNCSVLVMAAKLLCLRGLDEGTKSLAMAVQANLQARVDAHVATLEEGMGENITNLWVDVGGTNGSGAFGAFHLFRVPRGLDLWRVSLRVPDEFQIPGNTYYAYVMHESSPCLASILRDGGCFDPVTLLLCTHSAPVSFRPPDEMAFLKISMSMSFSKSATLTLSRGSYPRLQSGRWLLFVTCYSATPKLTTKQVRIDVEFARGHGQSRKLWLGGAIMVLGPILVLFCTNAINFLAHEALYRMRSAGSQYFLWPVCMSLPNQTHMDAILREKMKYILRPVPFFPGLLALMIGVFLATAAQFVLAHYGLMVRTGNRDICFYNEKCFFPGLIWDVPWNHMLSNLAYFVAAAHTMMQAFLAEVRCRQFLHQTMSELFNELFTKLNIEPEQRLAKKQWETVFQEVHKRDDEHVSRRDWFKHYGNFLAFDFIDTVEDGLLSRKEWSDAFDRLNKARDGYLAEDEFRRAASEIDLRAFYALALTYAAEGIGSMCYHLCPSVETFQFDTCFMIPIANLLTITLVDWSETYEDTTTALRYFIYILTPVWVITFIGTWYDIDVFDCPLLYWIYAVSVVVWTVAAVVNMHRLFKTPKWLVDRVPTIQPMGKYGKCAMRAMQVLLVVVVGLAFAEPTVRRALGGTANTFLLLSIVLMIVVVSRQIFWLDLWFMNCEEIGTRIIKYNYLIVMVCAAVLANHCFNQKVVIVTPDATPAQSHDANQDCVIHIFDLHDWWHFLSAIALALFAMLLLDIRVHSWARKSGIQIIFEEPTQHWCDVPVSSEEDFPSEASLQSDSDSN